MSQGVISVIVPVFNTESYLAACLDSIISQSYKKLEIIVVNDGSSDFSLKIAQTYAEKEDRITVYSHDNEGLSAARNRGLEVATGDYIVFVDSDDTLLPDALEVMMDFMIKENADLVEGRAIKGNLQGKIISPKNIKYEIFTPREAISNVLYQHKMLPSMWGKLFKKNLFENVKFETGILYEDLNIFYRLMDLCKRIVLIDYPVYFYRQNDKGIMHTWKENRLDVLKVTEHIEDYISKFYPELIGAAKDRRLSANFNMFALCSIHGDKENAKKCWDHIRNNRRQSLFNSRVRLKNKAGIILSYFGHKVFSLFARQIYSK